MDLSPHMLFAKVRHRRLEPRARGFSYGVFYFAFPLSQAQMLSRWPACGFNRRALLSVWEQDHGSRDGSSLLDWARAVLRGYGLEEADGEIVLITMPRYLGHVFNPISFFLCLDGAGRLRGVISEVNNTFGERHAYVCFRDDHGPIGPRDVLYTDKLFHVSPFLERNGRYGFRFDLGPERFGAWIDYFDADGARRLVTSLTGSMAPFSCAAVAFAAMRYPLVSAKVLGLIHWQALKLFGRGMPFHRKPAQLQPRLSGGPSPSAQPRDSHTPKGESLEASAHHVSD